MGLTSLQVCMDSSSSDWLQGTSHDDHSPGMQSSQSPLSPNVCSGPLSMERRLRPLHDQALKCPRCDSTHTKFCYYNNYSLTQPRYFCKACRRYWTKGGTLRNIPVGGGCRKNKKSSSSSSSNSNKKQNDIQSHVVSSPPSFSSATDLQLSFPDHAPHFSHVGGLFHQSNPSFLPIDFMESKFEGIVGNSNINSYDFMGNNANNNSGNNFSMVNNLGHGLLVDHNFHANICAPFSLASSSLLDSGNGVDTCQRLVMPYGDVSGVRGTVDVKPSARLLSLDWQQEQAKDSFGYLNGLGAWTSGVMNNYGPSSTNPLV